MNNSIRMLLIAASTISAQVFTMDQELKTHSEEIESPFKDGITKIGYSSVSSTLPKRKTSDDNTVIFHGTTKKGQDIKNYLINAQKRDSLEMDSEIGQKLDQIIGHLQKMIVAHEVNTTKKSFEQSRQKEEAEQKRINEELDSLFGDSGLSDEI